MKQAETATEIRKLMLQDIVLSSLHTARFFVTSMIPHTKGNDLALVHKALNDAIVTFAGAMTPNGLPEEVNSLLRSEGFDDLVDI